MLILDLLAQGRDMYGLELVEASSGRIKRGTVYVTLYRMEQKGFVASHQEPGPKAPSACHDGCTGPRTGVAGPRGLGTGQEDAGLGGRMTLAAPTARPPGRLLLRLARRLASPARTSEFSSPSWPTSSSSTDKQRAGLPASVSG